MDALVRYDLDGRVATLTMNRPEKRNALDGALVGALAEAFEAVAGEGHVRVVVLTGAGPAFSAGADLAALRAIREAGPMENLADSEHLARLFERIYRCPKPVVARVNGPAVAGGCGLAAVCDLSVAVETAKLGFTEVRIGFVPAIVSVFVRRKVGEAAARDLLLRGHLVDAATAADLGLITRAVPQEALDEAVSRIAREIASETSASAVALTKRLLADTAGMGWREAMDYAVQANAFARSTDDCRAGIDAFLERKDPPWRATSDD